MTIPVPVGILPSFGAFQTGFEGVPWEYTTCISPPFWPSYILHFNFCRGREKLNSVKQNVPKLIQQRRNYYADLLLRTAPFQIGISPWTMTTWL